MLEVSLVPEVYLVLYALVRLVLTLRSHERPAISTTSRCATTDSGLEEFSLCSEVLESLVCALRFSESPEV